MTADKKTIKSKNATSTPPQPRFKTVKVRVPVFIKTIYFHQEPRLEEHGGILIAQTVPTN
jgi:hypothetical protein